MITPHADNTCHTRQNKKTDVTRIKKYFESDKLVMIGMDKEEECGCSRDVVVKEMRITLLSKKLPNKT
jgi:peptidase E